MDKQLHDRKKRSNKPSKKMKSSPKTASPTLHSSEIEGEGSYAAGRKYDGAVRDFVQSGQVPESATEARKAIDGAEAEELRRAEVAGKRGKIDRH